MPSPSAPCEAEEAVPIKPPTPPPPPPTTRVFINDVDTWGGRTIAKRFLASREIWLAEVAAEAELNKPPPSPTPGRKQPLAAAVRASSNMSGGLPQVGMLAGLLKGKVEQSRNEDGEYDASNNGPIEPNNYEIYGSLSRPDATAPSFVEQGILATDSVAFEDQIRAAAVIVYNICEESAQVAEATRALHILGAEMKEGEEGADGAGPDSGTESGGEGWGGRQARLPNRIYRPAGKQFILLSSPMTWALSADPDPEDGVWCDDDYFYRKPHPHFKDHLLCEKLALKLNAAGKLASYVVTAGFMYGNGEGIFHHLFRGAWLNPDTSLACLGTGDNVLPTAHIKDVAELVVKLEQRVPKQSHFVLVDGSQVTLKTLVSAVSAAVGTGKTQHIPLAEGVLIPDMTQMRLDSLLCSLQFRSCTRALEKHAGMKLAWSQGPAAGAVLLQKEFLEEHGLHPVRICVQGPPAVGKTSVADKLAYYYRVQHITEAVIVEHGLQEMRMVAGNLATLVPEEEVPEEEKEEWKEKKLAYETARDTLAAFLAEPAGNRHRYDEFMGKWLVSKLNDIKCRVHGYVLDNFPQTQTQCSELFGAVPLNAEQRGQLPDFVAHLDAPDDFLKDRVLNLPEKDFQLKYSVEDGALDSYLADYHAAAADADPKKKVENPPSGAKMVLDYFRIAYTPMDDAAAAVAAGGKPPPPPVAPETSGPELSGKVDVIDATLGGGFDLLVEDIRGRVGIPRNFGTLRNISFDEAMSAKRVAVRLRKQQLERISARKSATLVQAKAKADAALGASKEEHESGREELELATVPIRRYMTRHVMPTMTQALIAVANAKPEDPIAFLSEYLAANTLGPVEKIRPPNWPKLDATTMQKLRGDEDDDGTQHSEPIASHAEQEVVGTTAE